MTGIIKHKHVLTTALKTALVVGTLLAFINHYEEILSLTITKAQAAQILVTYFVPFSVATYAGMKQVKRSAESTVLS